MDESKAIEYLMHFGMSRQEATVYLRLIEAGKQTGYEIARDTGISRSNVYASLAARLRKGLHIGRRGCQTIYSGSCSGVLW